MMLKQILNLEGIQKLSKSEQKAIKGGKRSVHCDSDVDCEEPQVCASSGFCEILIS